MKDGPDQAFHTHTEPHTMMEICFNFDFGEKKNRRKRKTLEISE